MKSRIKEWITLETRVSLFQTAMNNAGRNFTGKRVPVKRMADFAGKFYELAMKQVDRMGEISIEQLQKMYKKKPRKRKASEKKDMKEMMNKIKKKGIK